MNQSIRKSGPQVIFLFILNSGEHEIFPAHKCLNANNCWHFNIYEQEKIEAWAFLRLNNAGFLDIFILMCV